MLLFRVLAGAAVLAGAVWARSLDPVALGAMVLLGVVAAAAGWRSGVRARWFGAVVVIGGIAGGVATMRVRAYDRDPVAAQRETAAAATAALAAALEQAAVDAESVATRALDIAERERDPFAALAAQLRGPGERAVVVAERGRPV
ncbi:MAG: hypothetical protein K2X99_06075, partial [Gemmatimonadaceae bacterium]|nr:hypothetical protein [Gemmatimonadaceae bacterium]